MATGRRHGSDPWCRSSWLLFTAVSLVVGVWLLTHRMMLEVHSGTEGSVPGRSHGGSASVGEQTKHLKTLLAETTALLRDVMASNLTASSELLRKDAARVGAQRAGAQAEINRLPVLLGAEESKVARCVAEKHDVLLELQQCRQEAASHSAPPQKSWSAGLFNPPPPPPSSPPALPTTTSQAGSRRWLVVGIPTVARAHDEDYLLTALRTVADLLPRYRPCTAPHRRTKIRHALTHPAMLHLITPRHVTPCHASPMRVTPILDACSPSDPADLLYGQVRPLTRLEGLESSMPPLTSRRTNTHLLYGQVCPWRAWAATHAPRLNHARHRYPSPAPTGASALVNMPSRLVSPSPIPLPLGPSLPR